MFFSGTKKDIFGLDIGSSSIKLLQLKESKGAYQLVKFGIKPLDPEMIVEGTIMDASRVGETIKNLIEEQKIKTKNVALSVSGHSVIVKKITVPPMTEEELEESIKWEAEQYIPFDINDVNIDFHILETTEGPDGRGQMNVLLVAVKKDKLTEYTSLVTEVGLTPMVVDVDSFALENMYGINYDIREGEIAALVNIGASVLNINILRNGTSVYTRDISTGGNKYTEAVQRGMGLSYEEAEQAKKGEEVQGVEKEALQETIRSVNDEVISEITRSLDFFKTTTAFEKIDAVIISGGSAKMPGLLSSLSEKLSLEVGMADPFRRIDINKKAFDADYLKEIAPQAAVGVGLAIRRIGDR